VETILETDRLILRAVDPVVDFDRWADVMADPESVRYIGNVVMSREKAWQHMSMIIGHMEIRGYSICSVIEKSTQRWVGRVGPWFPLGWPAPEIAWTLHPDSHGKGFAIEAAAAWRDYVFETLGWEALIHVIVDGNEPSMKVAERIGSTRQYSIDGLPGMFSEKCWVYGQDNPA